MRQTSPRQFRRLAGQQGGVKWQNCWGGLSVGVVQLLASAWCLARDATYEELSQLNTAPEHSPLYDFFKFHEHLRRPEHIRYVILTRQLAPFPRDEAYNNYDAGSTTQCADSNACATEADSLIQATSLISSNSRHPLQPTSTSKYTHR